MVDMGFGDWVQMPPLKRPHPKKEALLFALRNILPAMKGFLCQFPRYEQINMHSFLMEFQLERNE